MSPLTHNKAYLNVSHKISKKIFTFSFPWRRRIWTIETIQYLVVLNSIKEDDDQGRVCYGHLRLKGSQVLS